MLRSFDFYLALAVWVMATPTWISPKWHEQVISILPNLLGFTLGGFAIFLGFGSDDFKRAIARKDEDSSPYLSVNAAFMLFVCFQLAALLVAIISNSLWSIAAPDWAAPWTDCIKIASKVGGGFGYFLFCYSLALVLRAAVRIFRLGRWYNAYLHPHGQRSDEAVEGDPPPPCK